MSDHIYFPGTEKRNADRRRYERFHASVKKHYAHLQNHRRDPIDWDRCEARSWPELTPIRINRDTPPLVVWLLFAMVVLTASFAIWLASFSTYEVHHVGNPISTGGIETYKMPAVERYETALDALKGDR